MKKNENSILRLGEKYIFTKQHESNSLLFRREQEELLRQKEAERRTAIEEKENARVSYREKMKNATVIDVSRLIQTSNTKPHYIRYPARKSAYCRTYRLILGNRRD